MGLLRSPAASADSGSTPDSPEILCTRVHKIESVSFPCNTDIQANHTVKRRCLHGQEYSTLEGRHDPLCR